MLTSEALAKLLIQWRMNFGVKIRDHWCVPTNRPDRMAMYMSLIETLTKINGYVEEDFNSILESRVIEASMSPTSDNRAKWKIVATRDWQECVVIFFPQKTTQFEGTIPERKDGPSYQKTEYVNDDPRLYTDNPVDRSVYEGLPPVDNPVDEEFLKMLEGVGDE